MLPIVVFLYLARPADDSMDQRAKYTVGYITGRAGGNVGNQAANANKGQEKKRITERTEKLSTPAHPHQ